MNTSFQRLDPKRVLELKIVRKGWFKTQYILTDDQFEYGTISCIGNAFRIKKQIATADGTYIIKPVGFFAKETQIINADNDEVIGTLTRSKWDTTNTITLNNGFTATLAREGGIFSSKVSWSNADLGNFITLKACYKFSRAFTIMFDQGIVDKPIPVALLSLVGANIVLTKQAQAAAATI